MKKLLFALTIAGGLCSANAQQASKTPVKDKEAWSLELNVKPGLLSQNLSSHQIASRYTDALNAGIQEISFSKGNALGFDVQLGYYFDRKRQFGIGSGILFFSNRSEISMNVFHIEYRSADQSDNTFRQVITARNPLNETVTTNSLNIPLLFKYKRDLNSKWGISADAGLLWNISSISTWAGNAAFDYEAIYKFDETGVPVYDASPIPDRQGWLITREHYIKNNPQGNADAYFSSLQAEGYNVGLNVPSKNTSGKTSYKSSSLGLLVQPSVSYRINEAISLNAGVFLCMQWFANDNDNKKLTDKVGEYQSLTNFISKNSSTAWGLNIGVRYSFGKPRDNDKDGIANRYDLCPEMAGTAAFNGCPDTDGDGVEDKNDACPAQAGPASLNGCPDRDMDGIADKDDACAELAGVAALKGCPDSDKDGIADKDDACPEQAGELRFSGCPDSDGDEVPDHTDQCVNEKGSPAANGCPDADNDGVKDADDKCPQLAGSITHNGCPDSDRDGIFDDADSCINLAGTAGNNGCPDVKEEARQLLGRSLKGISFETGSAMISKASYPYLRSVVKMMKDNPSYRLLVQGHTDNTGNEDANMKISQQRADAVASWLTKNGIQSDRIEASGFGSSQPAVDNDTESGRVRNRRVELKVEFLK